MAPATCAINNVFFRTTSPCKPSSRSQSCISCGQQCLRSTASRGSLIKPALDTTSASGFLNTVMVTHTGRSLHCRYCNCLACTAFDTGRSFYTCHFGVHAAIALHERRQFPSGICYMYHNNICIMQVKLDKRVCERV